MVSQIASMFWLTVSAPGVFLTSLGAKVKKSVCQQYYSVDLANTKKQNAPYMHQNAHLY